MIRHLFLLKNSFKIIISIFSLNTREGGSLNEVGKIEANRAAYAYMLTWVNQSS